MRSTSSSSLKHRTARRSAFFSTAVACALVGSVGLTAASGAQAEASDASLTMTRASFHTSLTAEPIVTAAGTDEASAEMREALASADVSVAAAATVTADIQASGVDVGEPGTTVDTAELKKAADRLEEAGSLPAPLVLGLISDVTDLVEPVNERVAGLRGSLDAALAQKAAEEAAAAEAARVAAEQAAAEAAAAAKAPQRAPSGAAPRVAASGTSAADAQAIAHGMLGGYGWGDDQFGCLVSLWNKESGWNYQAYNRSSGATGIPQALPGSKMASAGADWQTNPATQISWGLGYIAGRYGSPCGAWSHSQSVGWY
ncbi:MAG TPA: 16S rRNA pseudouridylate synthase [Microbacterium sp.]|nr:16S rRNA pseudouridylate synthase [Microbacterium sp.]